MDCGPDGKAFRRLNAIHLLLVGASFEVVLRNSRVSERTLRLWISRFNERGIEGLTYRPYTGRPRKMDPARVTSDILALVDDPSLANQTHWTLTKLCGWLRQESRSTSPIGPWCATFTNTVMPGASRAKSPSLLTDLLGKIGAKPSP
jgi:transposase